MIRLEREIDRLRSSGLVPVPLCKPIADGGGCSALAHGDCQSPGKRPLLRGYAKLTSSAADRRRVLSRAQTIGAVNLGITTGRGIVVVETDSPGAAEEITLLCGKLLDRTVKRAARPGRGPAWFFQTAAQIDSRAHLGASGAIDVRGEGGILVVPPSVHATGHHYSWVRAPWDARIADLPTALVRLIVRPTLFGTPTTAPTATITAKISPRVSALLRSRRHLAQLWEGEGKHRGDTSASGYDFEIATQLLASHVAYGEVEAAIAARSSAHRDDAAYVRSTVNAARRALRGRRRR